MNAISRLVIFIFVICCFALTADVAAQTDVIPVEEVINGTEGDDPYTIDFDVEEDMWWFVGEESPVENADCFEDDDKDYELPIFLELWDDSAEWGPDLIETKESEITLCSDTRKEVSIEDIAEVELLLDILDEPVEQATLYICGEWLDDEPDCDDDDPCCGLVLKSVEFNIENAPPPPLPFIQIYPRKDGLEPGPPNGVNGEFEVKITNGVNAPEGGLRVNYYLGGEANSDPENLDYKPIKNMSALIPAGKDRVTIFIEVLDDQVPEGTETVEITSLDGEGYNHQKLTWKILIFDDDDAIEDPVVINPGFNDAWRNAVKKGGQGVFIVVLPDIKYIFLAWFTYDMMLPDEEIDYTVGHPSQRWYTAFGPYEGDTAVLDLELNSNGIFDSAAPFTQVIDGTVTVKVNNCEQILFSYDITSAGKTGDITLERTTDDNVAYCESFADGEMAPASDESPDSSVKKVSGNQIYTAEGDTDFNAGFNDAWRNPVKKGGQGVFAVVFPVLKSIFMAWFTYDTENPADDIDYSVGHPSQRWYTAYGPYEGDTAVLDLELNSNGIFDSAAPFEQSSDGTVTLESIDCEGMLMTYDILSADLQGEIPLGRVSGDNVPYCLSLE
jgi:hypothetical protein